MECIQECTAGDERLEIMTDDSCESPREWDNLTVIVTIKNNHHDIGDIQVNSSEQVHDVLDTQKAMFAMPLYIYEHSGISLRCFEDKIPKYPYNDQWDAGCIGMVFTTKEKLRQAGLTHNTKKEVMDQMMAEVETYSHWCNGDCYGFRLSKVSRCDKCNQVEDNEIGSCYGFYGWNPDTNGLYDAILENSKVFKTYDDLDEFLK